MLSQETPALAPQYYDEDTNQCHSLQLNLSDNALYQIESDTAIPAELDPLIASVESQIVQV